MLGTKVPLDPLLPHLALDTLVPPDQLYRRLDHILDLSFVRDLVRPYYAAGGRPSIDPVVFFKLQLVRFFEGIRSERQLMRHAADHLSVRRYLGYELHERLPHHSSLTRIRDRFGLAVFRHFFAAIVERCIAAGLVSGRALYLDSTAVEANAAFDSLKPRWFVEAHRAAHILSEQQAVAPAESHCLVPPEVSAATRAAQAQVNRDRHDWIAACGQQDRAQGNRRYTRRSDSQASTTDPDATVLPHRGGSPLGYHTHYVVDNGKARTILAVLVTPAEVQDNQPMLDLVVHTRFRWQLALHHVTGDSKYGTVDNIVALERAGIRAYVPISDVGTRPGMLGKRHFVYDSQQNVYRCPQGTSLHQTQAQVSAEHTLCYRAPAKTCNTCPIKPTCTTSMRGRTVQRHVDEAYVDRVRAYHQTAAYQRAIRKRQVWVEPLFGEAKQWHGLRRFQLRRLAKVNIEALLIATGQNIKRLLQQRGRPMPQQRIQVGLQRPWDEWCARDAAAIRARYPTRSLT